MKTIKIALVMALILQMANYTFAYENEPTEASQSLTDGYIVEDYNDEIDYICDSYCEAESWVIDNLVPKEMWLDENKTDFDHLWNVINILTEAKLNGEYVE